MSEDTISRQAAIDALTRFITPHDNGDGTMTVGVLSKSSITDILNDLPSAQPETHDKRTETHACDCISRQAAIDRINKQREHLQPDIYPQDEIGDAAYRICAEFIERLPSAQPETCEDTISRKEAIEAFDNLEWFHQNANKDMVSGANPEHHQAWYKEQDVYKTLEQLPSVKLFAVLQRACKHRCLSMDRYGGDSELHPTCHHEIYADVSWGECVEGKCPLLNPHKEERRTDDLQ